jgi:hypothetical protein
LTLVADAGKCKVSEPTVALPGEETALLEVGVDAS